MRSISCETAGKHVDGAVEMDVGEARVGPRKGRIDGARLLVERLDLCLCLGREGVRSAAP